MARARPSLLTYEEEMQRYRDIETEIQAKPGVYRVGALNICVGGLPDFRRKRDVQRLASAFSISGMSIFRNLRFVELGFYGACILHIYDVLILCIIIFHHHRYWMVQKLQQKLLAR